VRCAVNRVLRLAGVVSCTLVLAAFALGLRWSVYLRVADHADLELVDGAIQLQVSEVPPITAPHLGMPRPLLLVVEAPRSEWRDLVWLPDYWISGWNRFVAVPLWILLVLLATVTMLLWRRKASASRAGYCVCCGCSE
jgi:hypothetical protein